MKKMSFLFCILCISVFLLISVASAETGEFETLPEMNLKIFVPENTTAALEENEYYIYGGEHGSIPYVMVRTYDYTSAEKFISLLTPSLQKKYEDLQVIAEAEQKTIGDKNCWEIDYGYTIKGHPAIDRRIVMTVNGTTYVFCSKEIEELGMTIGNMLDEVAANSEFISLKGDNSDTLANWKIKIYTPNNTTAVLKGSEYYIYAQNEGSIPYVMLTPYGKYDSGEKFLSDFTEYMMKQHEDLTVVTDPVQRTIGDKDCWETAYKYDVSGNEVVDRRIVTIRNNAAYLFTSKECKELNMMVDNMLEEVITNAEFIP